MSHREVFYVDPKAVTGDSLLITGAEYKHLVRVARKRVGERVEVVDGQGDLYECQIAEISPSSVRCQVYKKVRRAGEPAFRLTLAQAIPKGGRFDFVLEKGTEIGVAKFIPLLCQHSVVREASAKKQRWQKICLAAMKQCGRSFLPEVTETLEVGQVLADSAQYHLKLFAHPVVKRPARKSSGAALETSNFPKVVSKGIILIGPEGGFTTEEVRQCLGAGFEPISLGPRRLRSETAGLIAATLVLARMGEL